jgi:hypothetical protein
MYSWSYCAIVIASKNLRIWRNFHAFRFECGRFTYVALLILVLWSLCCNLLQLEASKNKFSEHYWAYWALYALAKKRLQVTLLMLSTWVGRTGVENVLQSDRQLQILLLIKDCFYVYKYLRNAHTENTC